MYTSIKEYKKYLNENKQYKYVWPGFTAEIWKHPRKTEWKWIITDTDTDTYNYQSDIDSVLRTAKDAELDMFNVIKNKIGRLPDKQILESLEFDTVANIGKITKDIKIDVLLKHSFHSLERQGRGTKYIKNEYIKETVDLGTNQIIDALIENKINIKDTVWIYNSKNNLNVVGALLPTKEHNKIMFKLITVMFTKDFKNKHKTFKITV